MQWLATDAATADTKKILMVLIQDTKKTSN